MAQLLDLPEGDYIPRQMGYDLRRLARKGLIHRVEAKPCYILSPLGRRAALFLTMLYVRVLRPGFHAVDPQIRSQVPPPLRRAVAAVDAATDALLQEARLVA